MQQTVFGVLAITVVSLLTYLVGEGLYAVIRWDDRATSATYRVYERVSSDLTEIAGIEFDPRADADLYGRVGPAYVWQLGEEELDRLFPLLQASGVAIGNAPKRYHVMAGDIAVNDNVDGCRVQRPNLRKTMTFLRTNIFNPFDPLNVFYDADADLPPEIDEMIETYGVRKITHTTNDHGERITLPTVAADRKVVIAGASQAVGMMVADDETLSSQLQAREQSRQYVNVGVGGASPADTYCALEKAAVRYRGQIDELIYIYSESKFKDDPPVEVIDWLKNFAVKESISDVVVIFTPKIYNIVPQITRFRDYRGENAKLYAGERAELARLAVEAGFRYLDFSEVAIAEGQRMGSQFAALSVFVDHSHLSPYGTARLADRLMPD